MLPLFDLHHFGMLASATVLHTSHAPLHTHRLDFAGQSSAVQTQGMTDNFRDQCHRTRLTAFNMFGWLIQIGADALLASKAMEQVLLCAARLHAAEFAGQLVTMMLTARTTQHAAGIKGCAFPL